MMDSLFSSSRSGSPGDSSLFTLHSSLIRLLTPRYGEGEAQALVRALLEDEAGLTLTDILMGKADALPAEKQERLLTMTRRVAEGEPLQYVTGYQPFCGLRIGVEPGVLIPRPETEEWVEGLIREGRGYCHILDLCTGSGCIALALKQAFPEAQVEGWDISLEALAIARHNAETLGLDVTFRQVDVFFLEKREERREENLWDLITANPPYVLESERASMAEHVLSHEPSLALFVPDDDPLLFHRAIARRAAKRLALGGMIAMEINERFPEETTALLQREGFSDIHIFTDSCGKPRMVSARL